MRQPRPRKSAQRAQDEAQMRLCFALARRGAGRVSPNPMVGSVVVKGGEVIGTGWHRAFGAAHAEVNALRAAGTRASGGTLYVNLEPCSHHGATPPCADLIVDSNVARVVIGARDANPLVNGAGIRKLRRAGIEVAEGVLEEEAKELNKFFFSRVTRKTPYVALKLAQSLDGKIARRIGERTQISSGESVAYVHRLRSEYDAVLIGSGTFATDKPMLTVRRASGRDPMRVVLDSRLRGTYDNRFLATGGKVVVFTAAAEIQNAKGKALARRGAALIAAPRLHGGLDLRFVLRALGAMNVASLLVEGGGKIATSFLSAGLADELLLFIAPEIFGGGVAAFEPASGGYPKFERLETEHVGRDILIKIFIERNDHEHSPS